MVLALAPKSPNVNDLLADWEMQIPIGRVWSAKDNHIGLLHGLIEGDKPRIGDERIGA
jgi:hypothetical protein